jgi:hypothetical protein
MRALEEGVRPNSEQKARKNCRYCLATSTSGRKVVLVDPFLFVYSQVIPSDERIVSAACQRAYDWQ